MAMSHIPERVIRELKGLAFEVREVFGERGHLVDVALSADRAFRESRNRSNLVRSLVKDAVRTGASRQGVDCDDALGGAMDLRFDVGSRTLVFRLKKASRLADGSPQIIANKGTTWGDPDQDRLLPEEPWVFAFVANDDGIDELFVAPVLGVTGGNSRSLSSRYRKAFG